MLVKRALANIEAAGGSGLAKNTLVERYERGLMQRASQKLGRDPTPGLERVLSKRIQEAGRRYWDRLINLDERTLAGVEQVVGSETARERTEELRKREAERYETPLRERLKERYPNPSPEQKRKIEARVQTLKGLTTLTQVPSSFLNSPREVAFFGRFVASNIKMIYTYCACLYWNICVNP